jgi:hypothetical protein
MLGAALKKRNNLTGDDHAGFAFDASIHALGVAMIANSKHILTIVECSFLLLGLARSQEELVYARKL